MSYTFEKPKPTIYAGVSFRVQGIAIILIEGDSNVSPLEKKWKIVGFQKSDYVSMLDLTDMMLSILPSNAGTCYLCGSDRAILAALPQRVRDRNPDFAYGYPNPDHIQNISPRQFVPHIVAALNDDFVERSEDIALESLMKDLNDMEFSEAGQVKAATPSAEAFLFGMGELAVRSSLQSRSPAGKIASLLGDRIAASRTSWSKFFQGF